MKQELKDKWTEGLESGRYAQGHKRLRNLDNTYCCLGVLCDITGAKWEANQFGYFENEYGEGHTLHEETRNKLGLSGFHQMVLWHMNDGTHWINQNNDRHKEFDKTLIPSELLNGPPRTYSFKEIAEWIKKNIPVDKEENN